MSKVKNLADGPRGFNVLSEDGATLVMLEPGETSADVDLSVSHHPVLEGMIRDGELEVDGKSGGDAADAFKKNVRKPAKAPAPKAD